MATDTLTTMIGFDNLRAVLEEYGQAARNLYQDKLIAGGKIASGGLLNSAEFEVVEVEAGRRWEVRLELAEYWKWVEWGRKPGGRMPPVEKILDWIRIKPVIPYPREDGTLPEPENLAWAIAKSIARRGIEPFPAVAEAAAETFTGMQERIAEAVARDTRGIMPLLVSLLGGK